MGKTIESRFAGDVLVRRRSKVHLYAHFVWRTRGSEPRLTGERIERLVHRAMASEAFRLGCKVIAINGMPDHVHMLFRMPSDLCPSVLVKQIKGVSSTALNEAIWQEDPLAMRFRWQDGYACYSVGLSELESVLGYIRNQKRHHASDDVWPEWEETDEVSPTAKPSPEGYPAAGP